MKLVNLWYFFQDLQTSMRVALFPTLKALLREPLLVLRPLEVRRVYMAHVWTLYGDGADKWTGEEKERLVRVNASGVVLDLGAGHGHLASYLDKERVSAYVALEPNVHMHGTLRKKAREAGFVEEEGTFLLVGLPAEDVAGVIRALGDWATAYKEQHRRALSMSPGGQMQVDTLVSILTLCSIPSPTRTLRALVRDVLAPGGQLLFFEHVRSPRADVAWWQDALAPVWRHFFDGCVIGLDGVGVIREAGWARPDCVLSSFSGDGEEAEREARVWGEDGWASMEVWVKDGEEEESMFWHQAGRCVKRAASNDAH